MVKLVTFEFVDGKTCLFAGRELLKIAAEQLQLQLPMLPGVLGHFGASWPF